MIYLTHSRLMRESESSIEGWAEFGLGPEQRICSELLACRPRYATWISGHDRRMWQVARGRQRERQLTELRRVATEQVHRGALVRYLRDNGITGRERNRVLGEFYGTLDSDCAVLAEHRAYTRAVSTELCARDLLKLCYDRHGVELIEAYEREYGVFFAMHCDRARALADGRPYLLASLLPEVRAGAASIRRRLVSGQRLPPVRVLLPRPSQRRLPLPVPDEPLEREVRVPLR